VAISDMKMDKQFHVYIMTNKMRTVVYTGVTSDLITRVFQHKLKVVSSFTSRYNLNSLVYYEEYSDAYNAITREKQIKSWSKKRKNELINGMNPGWDDLSKKF
jgi:putative endonuclease